MINLKAALVGFSLIVFISFFLLQKIRARSEKIKRKNKIKNRKNKKRKR